MAKLVQDELYYSGVSRGNGNRTTGAPVLRIIDEKNDRVGLVRRQTVADDPVYLRDVGAKGTLNATTVVRRIEGRVSKLVALGMICSRLVTDHIHTMHIEVISLHTSS